MSYHKNNLRAIDNNNNNIDLVSRLGSWERWTLEVENNYVYIKSAHGTYLRADRDRTVNLTTNRLKWEQWTLEPEGDYVYLKSCHGTYLRADLDKTVNLTINQKAWERWKIKKVPSIMIEIITLIRNKSRHERVKNNDIMKYYNVNIFPAVDRKNKTHINSLRDKYKETHRRNHGYAYSLNLSTRLVLEKFLNSKDLYCFILEDDFKVVRGFPYNLDKVDKLISEIDQTYDSVDVLILHCRMGADDKYRCTGGHGCEGYILTRHGALKWFNILTGYAPPDSNGNLVTIAQNPHHKFKHKPFTTGFSKGKSPLIDLVLAAHYKYYNEKDDKYLEFAYTDIRLNAYRSKNEIIKEDPDLQTKKDKSR